jgi:phage terminase Nu1 subunit (DNA packaging protein)
VTCELPDEWIEQIAQRAAEILREDHRFMTAQDLADHFGVKLRTVKTWRSHGLAAYGPRAQMYDVRETEKWLEKQAA